MAIVPDTRTTGTNTLANSVNGATSVTWNHTVGSSLSNSILVVSCAQDSGARSTSVVWDDGAANTPLTFKGEFNTGTCRAEIWYLLNPASGTKTIRVSWTGSHNGQGGSASYSGVDQTTIWNAASPQTASGINNTNPSLTVTSATGEMVVDSMVVDLATNGSTPTKGASQTYIAAGVNTNNLTIASGHSDQPGAATVTMTWTLAAGDGAWAQVGASLLPASGGGGGGPPLMGAMML